MSDDKKAIRRAALDALARRDYSWHELQQKLLTKGFPEVFIAETLQTLQQEGLLNEQRLVEHYIGYRARRGYGPLRIRQELNERGIPQDLIEHQLKINDNGWRECIKQVWKKRFKNQRPKDFKARAQQMRFLHYRGFTQAQIDCIFNSED